ncbi:MAG: phospho-N-acetylmuramoyl-pentapeptide-transferase [Dissulfurimicrobium sp.]|uniref:phospho-N-acetylmuramoyl-pentapeptide- transferase n=1 Tax=Dissulfurimicrobium TaxID=1769732 RepID=UPI001EDA9F7A|nr:phospho-N-acetylmuramoyl-pentapeptide-transferase [Dissulfurimicrobium hydrothermale]UKL12885.1 phospho-N-acetylmuramoyl-pentapeptide-transferase [Dissulfurimicrobium hydrothermale]
MIFYLLYPLHEFWPVFNVFRYITFRTIYATVMAFLVVFLLGDWFIKRLRAMQMGQVIRQDGPKAHLSKAGTPSTGGVLIVGAIAFSTLLWADLKEIYIWICLIVLLGFGAIGLADDILKIKRRNSRGLPGRWKLVCQAFFCAVAGYILFVDGYWGSYLSIPFFKNIRPDIGMFYFFFAMLVVIGASNAVNLTDGLDGLATGPFVVAAAVYTLFSYLAGHVVIAEYLQIPYVPGAGELAVFCGAMVGAGLGFLWYNSYPASIFMGDSGSLAMGGALGTVAVLIKQELLLVIVGGIFVVEALSVIIQVGYYKATGGRRVFKMAPLHHHFELLGVNEPKVIVRFWIVAIILGLLAISTLKLR